jgi:hypothetical protein
MDVEITPRPEPDERQAIEVALRRLMGRGTQPLAYTSAWRKAGLREAVEEFLVNGRQTGATPPEHP